MHDKKYHLTYMFILSLLIHYPFIKCDLIIIHNNQNNDNDDDNGGGDTIHTKYQDIDLFTHDMKNKTIFLEINTVQMPRIT